MKIKSATIKNFRQIKHLELDLTDSLGAVRKTTGIVGPNTSGKTTILDALSLALGAKTELPDNYIREHLQITPDSIVRHGALRSEVTCTVQFSADEIEATRELLTLSEETSPVPNASEVKITWTYPDPYPKAKVRGWRSECNPRHAWTLFKGRARTARLLSTRRITDLDYFKRVGGVFLFDQQRTGMGKTISQETWQLLGRDNGNGNHYTTDPRAILLDLAVKEKFDSTNKRKSDFQRVKKAYEAVASPHRLIGAQTNQLNELELVFEDGQHNKYNYSGLSSGEQMLLLYVIKLVTNNVHQSIIFVDELELHQHPFWQRKLLHHLPKIGINNQLIYTTHSPYLRDGVNPESIIDLGELGEHQREVG